MTKSLEKVEKDPAGDQLQALRSRAFAPLREPAFRRTWTASLLANFGQLILGVGVAWKMTRLTSSASMVALVQTAMMLLLMLVALPAGALVVHAVNWVTHFWLAALRPIWFRGSSST